MASENATGAPTSKDISQTFAKGMSVLKAFDEAETDLSLAEIARRAELDRAVARRLVLTLVHLGYVRRIGRAFRLTPKVLVLASGFLRRSQLTKAVVPILNEYSREIGAPIYLATRDGHDVVYLAHAALENRAISLGFSIGSRLPLLSTSIGRALIAFLPQEEREALVAAAPLKAFTDRTIMDRAAILAELGKARDLGYAFADGEFEAGVAALAAPVASDAAFPIAIGVSLEREAFSEAFIQSSVRTLRHCRNNLADAVALF